jgi:hypothetical protein
MEILPQGRRAWIRLLIGLAFILAYSGERSLIAYQ